MGITRRRLLHGAAWAGALALAAPAARGEEASDGTPGAARPRKPGAHRLAPLPFDPKKLRGLSERLIRSHHENNHGGAVRKLNAVEKQLAALPADAPGFRVGGLRSSELVFHNSVVLHELYFGNLGGDGEPAGAVARALSDAPGGRARFGERFRATAGSLAGGSGWALLSYDFQDDGLRIQWAGDHSQSLVAAEPLLVLDMYEHSYHLDYGAAAARYVEAFMDNVDWEVVDRRYRAALGVAAQRRAAR